MSSSKENKKELPSSVDAIIRNIAHENGYDDFQLEVTALDTGGGNYTGDLFTIDVLQDGKEPLHLFSKASNVPLAVRGQAPVKKIFEREIFVYTALADAFEALQSNHRVPAERRLRLAKYYGSDLGAPEVLVLENLAKKGYVMYDRRTSMNWDYAKTALEELAKFHALSFALEIENPKLYEELIRNKDEFKTQGEGAAQMFNVLLPNITKTLFLALDAQYVEPFRKYCDGFRESWPKEFQPLTEQSVLVHGDYRISNHMVKYGQNGKLKTLMSLDYQMIFHGSPINDIMYLLFTGSDEAFRREHYEDYIQQYYYELARALAALHHRVHNVYPRALYLQHVREKLLYGLGVAVFMLPIMMVEAEDAPSIPDAVKNMGSGGDGPTFRGNALYAERLNGIAADMRRWGVLDVLR